MTCTVRTVYHPVHMITGCDNLWSRLLMFPFSVWPRYPLSCLVNDDLNWITDWLYLFLGFSSTNKPRDDVFKTSLWNCNAQTSRTSCFLRSTTVVFGRDSAGRASIVTLSSCPAFFFFLHFWHEWARLCCPATISSRHTWALSACKITTTTTSSSSGASLPVERQDRGTIPGSNCPSWCWKFLFGFKKCPDVAPLLLF